MAYRERCSAGNAIPRRPAVDFLCDCHAGIMCTGSLVKSEPVGLASKVFWIGRVLYGNF